MQQRVKIYSVWAEHALALMKESLMQKLSFGVPLETLTRLPETKTNCRLLSAKWKQKKHNLTVKQRNTRFCEKKKSILQEKKKTQFVRTIKKIDRKNKQTQFDRKTKKLNLTGK